MGVSFSPRAPFFPASPDGGELFAFFFEKMIAALSLPSRVASFLSSLFPSVECESGGVTRVISQAALLGVPTSASSTALAPESCCIDRLAYYIWHCVAVYAERRCRA